MSTSDLPQPGDKMIIREPAQSVNSGALMPVMSVQEAVARYNAIVSLVHTELWHDGIDSGVIPGTDKATLYKAGAEKLTTFFGLAVSFELAEAIEDWTGKDHDGEPFFYYRYNCTLSRNSVAIATAVGSANSWESRYRWRWVAKDQVPSGLDVSILSQRASVAEEYDFALEKKETTGPYAKPAEYWADFERAIDDGLAERITKKSRKGNELVAWRIATVSYRVPNEDIYSQVNTIQKIAEKRAFVAATLIATNASEFFTQDLEDMAPETLESMGINGSSTAQAAQPKDSNGNAESKPPAQPPAQPQPQKRRTVVTQGKNPQELIDKAAKRSGDDNLVIPAWADEVLDWLPGFAEQRGVDLGDAMAFGVDNGLVPSPAPCADDMAVFEHIGAAKGAYTTAIMEYARSLQV